MRIYVVVEQSGIWYPQNAIAVLKSTGKFNFVNDPKEADIIWAFSYYQPIEELIENKIALKLFMLFEKLCIPIVPRLRIRRDLRDKLVIASFHHLYKPKVNTYIHRTKLWDKEAHVIQAFSHINIIEMAEYFTKPFLFAPYWLNMDTFRPYTPAEKRDVRAKYGIPEGKTIIGSFQRDSEKDGKPKLEKGPDILCDALEPLADRNIFVLLSGPRRMYVEGRLKNAGIPFKNVGTVPFDQMNSLYQCLDYYLVTSRVEGGPQAIIECMAGKIPILSSVCGVSGLLDPRVICRQAEEFTRIVRNNAYPDVIEQHYQTAKLFDVNVVADDYVRKFQELWDAFRRKDLGAMNRVCADSRAANDGQDFIRPAKIVQRLETV